MAHTIDMNDKNAWDDSFLQDSWNDAKYHSIAKSGKRLEDVLTQEELSELRDDHGDLIGEAETTSELVPEANDNSDQMDTEDSMQDIDDTEQIHQQETQPQETAVSEELSEPQTKEIGVEAPLGTDFAAIPQTLLGTVQDENLKNIMMSWYYAGYYTGLHAGHQLPKEAPPKP
ncbi:hypothetical protein E8E13_001768 [Curvularia kusanoi]|uniref:Survival motor neuron Tudor domain-containing protein n=1 Tax=Curvularia kusanoi TaxID=90978 RepID=A0A9P4T941_CURKU|nr:hypothetical protein E8E13_001768 [Curvularia kusanoi]